LAIVAIAAFAPRNASAGDYHSGTTLVCSDCHVAHYSVSHEQNEGGHAPLPLDPAGPFPRLLRNQTNLLCLTCHNNKPWAPDVFGANGGTAGLRLAGGLNSAVGAPIANDVNYADIDGHTLWSTAVAPGGTWSNAAGLGCTDCHSAHGAPTQYRNLRTSTSATNKFFGKTLDYAIGTNDGTKAVYERTAATYTEDAVDFNEPLSNASAYGAWCASCHPNFHGSEASANMSDGSSWLRHPTADATFSSSMLTRFSSQTNRVKVMDPSGTWTVPLNASVTPSCFSCHKSHGNQNGFGLIYMAGTGTVTEEGDGGAYRDLCRQCHTQGG
jgi:hypothetical protein